MARKKRKIDYSTFIPWLEPKTRAQKSQFILLQQQQQQQQQNNVIVIDNDNNNEESNNIRNSHFLNNADDNSNANNSSKKKKKKKKRKRLNNEELLQQQQQQQNNVIVIHNDNNNEESNNIRNSHFRNNTDDNSNAKCSAPKKKEKYNAKKKKEKKKKRRLIKEETLRRERNERNERNSAKRKRDEYENEDVLQKKNTRMGKKMEGTNKPEKKKKKGWKLKRKEKAKNKKKESRMHQMSNLLPHERQQHYHTSNVPWLSFKGNDSYENSEKSISSPSLSTTANNNKQQRQKVLLLPKSYYNLNPLVLNQFQKELTQFEQYIKLQPEEISARQHVIDYVTSLAKILFENDAYNHQDTIHTEIYGSFKSLQVCNFNSDVDMALWGAIDVTLLQDEEDDEEAGRGWFSRFKKRRQGKENKNEQVAKTITTAEEEKIAKKKRVAKWRDVLNTTQIDQEQQLSSSSELKSTGTNPVTSDCSNSGSDENCTDKDNHSNKESQNHHKDSNDDDESNDDADKMENYKRGCNNNGKKRGVIEEKESDDQSINFHACFNSATIDLCSSSSNSSSNETYDKNDDDDTTNMEISYVNIPNDNDNTTTSTKKRTQLPTLTRSARQKVVGALYQLRKKLHKSSIIDRVEVRAKARVPILCVSTCFGFDFDLSLGGQNGADTTNYVQAQVKRFKSFPTVALFLKALMQQTDLDKPFTGGLGSYRLYVLLAYHIEKHLSLGGNDTPGEILLSFFFRFSNIREEEKVGKANKTKKKKNGGVENPCCFTQITSDSILHSGGGEADLSAVFRIDECVALFGICFQRLISQLQVKSSNTNDPNKNKKSQSFLSLLINTSELQLARKQCLGKVTIFQKAEEGENNNQNQKQQSERTTTSTTITNTIVKNNTKEIIINKTFQFIDGNLKRKRSDQTQLRYILSEVARGRPIPFPQAWRTY